MQPIRYKLAWPLIIGIMLLCMCFSCGKKYVRELTTWTTPGGGQLIYESRAKNPFSIDVDYFVRFINKDGAKSECRLSSSLWLEYNCYCFIRRHSNGMLVLASLERFGDVIDLGSGVVKCVADDNQRKNLMKEEVARTSRRRNDDQALCITVECQLNRFKIEKACNQVIDLD